MKDILREMRSSLAWAVVAVVLGAVCLAVGVSDEEGGSKSTVLLAAKPGEVRELRVEFPGQDRGPVVARGQGKSGWRLVQPVVDAADDTVVTRVISVLSGLVATKTWDESESEADELGAIRLRVSLTLRTGAKHTVEVGNPTASGFRMYGRVSDRPGKVFEVTKAIWDAAHRPLLAYRKGTFFDVDYFDLDVIEARHGPAGRAFVLRKDGDGWAMEKPFRARADAKKVFQLAYDLDRLRASDFLPPSASLAPLGLDPPLLSVTLRSGKGDASRVDFGRSGGGEGGTWHARVHGREVTARVMGENLDALLDFSDPYRLRDRGVFTAVGQRVKSVEVKGTCEGRNVSYEIRLGEFEKSWAIVEPVHRPVDKVKWEEFLSKKLLPLRVESFVHEAPGPADLKACGLAPPSLRVTVTSAPDVGKKGGETSAYLELGGLDKKQGIVFARQEGEGPVLGVPMTFVDFFATGNLRFLDRVLPLVDQETVIRLEVRDEKGVVAWERGAGGQLWRIVQPPGRGVAQFELMEATLGLFGRAAKWVDEAPFAAPRDLAFYGLDDASPRLILTFTVLEKDVRRTLVLFVSRKGPGSNMLYARFRKGDLPLGDLVFLLERRGPDNVRKLMEQARK